MFVDSAMAAKYAARIAELIAQSDSEDDQDDFLNDIEDDEEQDIVEIDNRSESSCSEESDNTSEDDSENEEDNFKGKDGTTWSGRPPHSSSYRRHNLVRVRSGVQIPIQNCIEPIDFFSCLFTPTMIRHIVQCTNRRMPDQIEEVCDEEIMAYFGLLLLFGVTKKRKVDIAEIWKRTSIHYLEIAALAMPRDRFMQISRFITFDDVSCRTLNGGKFYKMDYIFQEFKNNIRTAYEPGSHVCVDETLYSFRGHCRFRQYMKNKPARYGLKYFCLCDVDTAYLMNVKIYLGKNTDDVARAKNIGMNVVLELTKPLYRTGRGVTTDNFFTSIELSDRLWANGLTLLGTLRHNKPQIPASFLPSKRRDIHDSQFGFRREKTLVSYVPQKNKAVILLSTEHHSQKMILSNTDPEVISKPEIIGAYNKTKGPVDTFDKLVSEYTCRRNTRRWTKNVLFFLLDAAGYNAFVLERSKFPQNFQRNKKRQRRLRLECLAEQLIAEQMKNRINKWKATSFVGVPTYLREAAQRRGLLDASLDSEPPTNFGTGRCQKCGREKDRKSRNRCHKCNMYVCADHSQPNFLVCRDCFQS